MKNRVWSFIREKSGSAVSEYGVMMALIVITTIGVIGLIDKF